jgi:hypothetical protein
MFKSLKIKIPYLQSKFYNNLSFIWFYYQINIKIQFFQREFKYNYSEVKLIFFYFLLCRVDLFCNKLQSIF